MTKAELRKLRKQAHAEGRPLIGELAIPGLHPTIFRTDEGRYIALRRAARRQRVAIRKEDAMYRWAKRYDELNGAPENDADR